MHLMPLLTELSDMYSDSGQRVTVEFQNQVKIYVVAVYCILLLGMAVILFPAISRVDKGIREKQGLLLLLPSQVVDHTPAVMTMINRCVRAAVQ